MVLSCNNNNNAHLTDTFQDNPGRLIPGFNHSRFYWSKDDGSDSGNWSYKTCKAPGKSSPSTYQHPSSTCRMLFLSSSHVRALKWVVLYCNAVQKYTMCYSNSIHLLDIFTVMGNGQIYCQPVFSSALDIHCKYCDSGIMTVGGGHSCWGH